MKTIIFTLLSLFPLLSLSSEYKTSPLPITQALPKACTLANALPLKALVYQKTDFTETNPTAIATPTGLITHDFNGDKQTDFLFMEYYLAKGDAFSKDYFAIQFVQCMSESKTWKRSTTDLKYAPSEYPDSVYQTSKYTTEISLNNNKTLEIFISSFGHNEGSCSTQAHYNYNLMKKAFQLIDKKENCYPHTPDYPIYAPEAPTMVPQ